LQQTFFSGEKMDELNFVICIIVFPLVLGLVAGWIAGGINFKSKRSGDG